MDARGRGAMVKRAEPKEVRKHGWVLSLVVLVAAVTAIVPTSSHAASWEVDDGTTLNWTNTLRYAANFRVDGRNSKLTANPNLDDGNRNFDKGLISNKIELFTELDLVSKKGFGARLSAMGWYDFVYNKKNDNPGFAGGAFPNQTSTAYDEFTHDTRNLEGRKIEIRDAFVFGKFNLAEKPFTVRAGQHALLWGESLFFANNAIAGAQGSFDITRLLADPTAEAKEFVLPVPQLSAQLDLSNNVSLGAYYQFRHKPNRLPTVGSYFSVTDLLGDGAERMLLGPASAPRGSDLKGGNSGQFGLQLRWRVAETDLGFYALRFHDKDPQLVPRLGFVFPIGVVPTSYNLAYHKDTTAYGFSANHTFDNWNFGLEASVRRNQALASSHAADLSGLIPFLPPNDNDGNPAYATGNTAHINLSTIWSVPKSVLFPEAILVGELAWNRLLDCRTNCNTALDPNATRDAISMRAVFTPTYRQVMPGLDLSVPVGIGYTPKGSRSSLTAAGFPPEGGGDLTIGVKGLYLNNLNTTLAYTHFFGSTGAFLDATNSFSYKQARKDRDFVSLTVRASF